MQCLLFYFHNKYNKRTDIKPNLEDFFSCAAYGILVPEPGIEPGSSKNEHSKS